MLNHYTPYGLLPDVQDMQDYKSLTPEEQEDVRINAMLFGCGSYAMAFIIVLAAIAICSSCSAPRIVEHHHEYQADTLAVQAAVDSRMQSWHAESEGWFRQMLSQYSASASTNEQEHETVTETVTTATDSLGRQIRTEQRTISRTLSREQQQQEQRITSKYEARLREAVDSVSTAWQQRYDSLAARVAQLDSTLLQKMPAGDDRPWYHRWLDNLRAVLVVFLVDFLVAFLVIFLVLSTRPLWWPLLTKLFSHK